MYRSSPPSITNSIILRYDIKRQGCTNESLKANPVLLDLSGNGHDMTLYNFAFSGNSGVGYYTNFRPNSSRANITTVENLHWIIHSFNTNTAVHNEPIVVLGNAANFYNKPLTVKVQGLGNKELIISDGKHSYILHDGANSVTVTHNPGNGYIIFRFKTEDLPTNEVEIEILPLYPNALVTRSSDYGLVEGLPLLNKIDGYTIIAKRKILSMGDDSAFLSKRALNTPGKGYGAFILEKTVKRIPNTFSFAAGAQLEEFHLDDITYLTLNSYNGKPIKVGTIDDNDFMLFSMGYKTPDGVGDTGSLIVLYSCILFNRTLTDEEINWVKQNLID